MTGINIGDPFSIPCLTPGCSGSARGTYGGILWVQSRKYTQCRNATCPKCDRHYPEIFEVWDEEREDYWVSTQISYDINPGFDVTFDGLGADACDVEVEEIKNAAHDLVARNLSGLN